MKEELAKGVEKNELNLATTLKLNDRANQREKFYNALKMKVEKRKS